jgi:glyoxylase-like metal-dependent hydrolase (beta-lactamase superfamily II)
MTHPLRWAESLPSQVQRIRLTSKSGLTVNAWLLQEDGFRLLIDAGFPGTAEDLRLQLRAAGVQLDALDAVLYTHTHEDHMGGGIVHDEAWQGRHVVAEGTLPAESDWYAFFEAQEPWGQWLDRVLPESPLKEALQQARARRPSLPLRHGGTGWLTRPRTVAHGHTVRLGPWTFRCVPAPGHDPWHVVWWEASRGWLFSGDVLLGLPTPLTEPMQDRWEPYLETLHRLCDLPDDTLTFPGHGRPWQTLHASVHQSWAHMNRLHEAARGLGAEPVDPFELAMRLVPAERMQPRQIFIWLSNTLAWFRMAHRAGWVRPQPDRTWVVLRAPEPLKALPVPPPVASTQA